METHKEAQNPSLFEEETVCHEVSHLFGSTDAAGQPIADGAYTPETLDHIRDASIPAG